MGKIAHCGEKVDFCGGKKIDHMLNVAAACNFWPLAAKASQLSFTNKLVDEATVESGADEEFPGFHDNAGLMLIFFFYNNFIGLGGAS